LSSVFTAFLGADKNVCPTDNIVVGSACETASGLWAEQAGQALDRLWTADAHDSACRATGRRGDRGNRVVKWEHQG
jgi:hypothetical protein